MRAPEPNLDTPPLSPGGAAAPLLPIAAGYAVGVIAAGHPWCLAALPGLGWVRPRRSAVWLLSLWIVLGAARTVQWQAHPAARLARGLPDDPAPVRLHVLVRTDPVAPLDPPPGQDAPEPSACMLEILHADDGGGWRARRGRVRATIAAPRVPLRYGDEVLIEGRWSAVPPPGNPGQFDWRAALARHRVHGLLRVGPADALVRLREDAGDPVTALAVRARRRWRRQLDEAFPQTARLLVPLLLGQRVRLDDAWRDAFVETGTMHLLVISGSHVGVVALLLEGLLRLLGVPWRVRPWLTAAGVGAYSLIVGWDPPVARATLMAWAVLGALLLGRVVSWWNVLAAAVLLLLWVNPQQLFDPGFQLSVGAVASLLLFARPGAAALHAGLQRVRPSWLRRYLAIGAASTTAVWLGLWPILAWYFHLVSPVSMLANLLVAPLVGVLVGAGMLGLLISTVADGVLRAAAGPIEALVRLTVACVQWCQRLPGGFWYIGQPAGWVVAGYYGLWAATLRQRARGRPAGWCAVAWMAGVVLCLVAAAVGEARARRWLTVECLDVGHGDAAVIRTPGGQTLLLDAGTPQAGGSRVLPYLHGRGLRRLDALILTHGDEDHIGGAAPVLERLPVRRLLTNGGLDDTMAGRRLLRLARARAVPATRLTAGMAFEERSGFRVDVLHPPWAFVPGTPPAGNENSLVLRLTMGRVRILLTGDLDGSGLAWLLGGGADLRAEVLKMPHHGSALEPWTGRFLDAVDPSAAIISVGRLHRLPSSQTLEALAERRVPVLSTRRRGAVRVRTDGRRLEIRTPRDPT
jgi:competence protein ComEC